MYTLGKVIGALVNYYRLQKSPNMENVEIYLDIDRVLDTFGPDVKKGILNIFADGRFESMSDKKIRTHKPTLDEMVRRLNGAEYDGGLGQLGAGDLGASAGAGSVGGMAGGDRPVGGVAGGTDRVGHLGGRSSEAALAAAQPGPSITWEEWE